jgi:hypothetical protein
LANFLRKEIIYVALLFIFSKNTFKPLNYVQMHAKLNLFDNVIVGNIFLDFKEIEEKK